MLTLTFSEFYNDCPDDDNIKLYVSRKPDDILYVGISQSSVWNRWFSSRGRMWMNIYGEWDALDTIGRHIVDNMPGALEWEVDLWTLKDSLDFLGIEYLEDQGLFLHPIGKRPMNIKDVESEMISALCPKYNVIYNNGTDKNSRPKYFEYLRNERSA